MRIVIPDDYQDAVRSLDCFSKLAGQQVTVYHDSVKDIETLATRFRDAEALVLIRERTAITEPLLSLLPKLKLICQTGQGMPHIDIAACTRHRVAVTVGGGTPYAPAELTWGLVLAAMRHIPQEVARMKALQYPETDRKNEKKPDRLPPLITLPDELDSTRRNTNRSSGFALGRSLRGRTLGIFGYGKIGSLVASYGRVFGMNVLVWGREGTLARARADGFETASSQSALFERSDVLSLHIKLTEETRGIVTPADLARMKPSSLLVNTSRASLIEHGALEEALRAGRPGYAALDVYEVEPLTDSPLLHMDRVVCTPHLGYVEKDSYELYFGTAFDQLIAFAEGNPVNIVNPQALEHS